MMIDFVGRSRRTHLKDFQPMALASLLIAAASAWITPNQHLFIARHQVTTVRYCPASWTWCPDVVTQNGPSLLKRTKRWHSDLFTLVARLDPSRRAPVPKPPPLHLLGNSVGKEICISNKGRKATIKKQQMRLFGRRRRPVRLPKADAWDAMEDCF